ncbi:FTR1 family iron permease [Bacillus badius]|uniref:Ferrous iron transport permease EfeU n=1 Tax=Bacillus badius TaxID=1455 RepID=A0ABR5AZP5_BACBA|nr:FTR1 family protein [Bacillus badius]KIL80189.1 Ferrous iron transport permease EfeU [Bacillus badius]MED4716237.1 FTR1 family iron permease [Bacillus badius]
MKKLVILCSLLLFLLSPMQLSAVQAEEDYGELFISVGDAMMKTKAKDWKAVETLIGQLNDDWKQVDPGKSKEAEKVDKALSKANKVLGKHEKESMLEALSEVSHALIAFEKEQNPVDEKQQRLEVKTAFMPILADLKTVIEKEDGEAAYAQYQTFLAAWNRKESIVREQSIPYYGQIETQMGFLRIALLQDEKNFDQIKGIYNKLESAVTGFAAGKELKAENNNYSLQTLVDLLGKADQSIDDNKPEEAVSVLQEFLTVWPSVEGDVRTRNGSLYTKLESDIPVIAGKLSSSDTNVVKEQQKKIKEYKQAVDLLQEKKNYTMWDAALIMLREGLEALLVVAALIAFLRKANASQHQRWIWLGALAGVVMSIVAAVFINIAFSAAAAGANREAIEGVTGILAVVMMIGVGVWLHQKSNMKAWNRYIEKQMGTALSTGSIISMAFVSFLSIFREGAETIIFYMGMAPSISTGKLLAGIVLALVILTVFAFLFIRYSAKIAVGPFFKIATILIYFLAFKILGVSIHALQLTGHIGTTQIQSLPIISWLGFYPTWETIAPQAVLLAIIAVTAIWIQKKEKAA